MASGYLTAKVDAATVRQMNVGKYDVGRRHLETGKRFFQTRGVAYDFQAITFIDEAAQALSEDLVFFHHENAQHVLCRRATHR